MGTEQAEAFEATGPDPGTGFFCHGRELKIGGDMEGQDIGLRAKARNPGPDNPFDQPGIFGNSRDGPGVVGTTIANFGVYGQFGNLAPPSDVKAGVAGIAEQTKADVGVYGQHGDPEPDHFTGAGVIGSSNRGIGIVGTSSTTVGVLGFAKEGFGILASSRASIGIAGFTSGTTPNTYGIWGFSGAPMGGDPVTAPAGVFGASSVSIGVKGLANQTPRRRRRRNRPQRRQCRCLPGQSRR